MKKISIIIPVYNVEHYLSRCIDSVLNQSYTDFEILLINDGSTDNSGNICDEYSHKDCRIQVFHQENGGVSAARNKGIMNANGYWISFIDADDWIEKDSLGKILNNGEINDIDFTIAKMYIHKTNDTLKGQYNVKNYSSKQIFNGIELTIKENYSRGSVCGVIYKRSFLIDNNIYFPHKLKNGEDTMFYTFCSIYASKIRFSETHFYNIFERTGSASRNWSFDRLLLMTDGITILNDYIESHENLSSDALNILNYNKYRIISNTYNNFHHCISLNNYLILRTKIKTELGGYLETGKIKSCRWQVKILNSSIDLFAISLIVKNLIKNLF